MSRINTHREYCRMIADDLEAHAEGRMCRCDCGAVGTLDEFMEEADSTICRCFSCKQDLYKEDLEVLDISYYLEEVYDYMFLVDQRMRYHSVRVTIVEGNPMVYIDTETRSIELYSGNERASWKITHRTNDAIDSYFEDVFHNPHE